MFALIAVGLPLIVGAGVAIEFGGTGALCADVSAGRADFCWMLARSTIVTLWQGGIMWRGTFYPLEELKRGVV